VSCTRAVRDMHAMYIVDVPRSVGYQHDKASKGEEHLPYSRDVRPRLRWQHDQVRQFCDGSEPWQRQSALILERRIWLLRLWKGDRGDPSKPYPGAAVPTQEKWAPMEAESPVIIRVPEPAGLPVYTPLEAPVSS
jgi:hypothetical protein